MRGAEIEATIYAWLNATYPAGPTWFDEEELPKDAPPLEVRMLCACNLIEYNIGNGGWSQFLWNCFDRWRTLINTAQEGYSLIGAKEQADALNILRELCERDEQACLGARMAQWKRLWNIRGVAILTERMNGKSCSGETSMNDASFGSKRMNRVSARLLAASTPNRSLNRTPLGGACAPSFGSPVSLVR
jgi:hypothetical protein